MNVDEYLEGTNPGDNTPSVRALSPPRPTARFCAMSPNRVTRWVPLSCSRRAERGFAFVNWIGNASGTAVPLPLLMNGHKIVSALFKVIGDDFSTRVPLSGKNVIATGSNIGATKETGEPNHAGNPGGKSIWWTWNPVSAGPVTISTAGSTFNTVLGVYTGSTVST